MLIARQSGGWAARFIHYGVFIWGQSELAMVRVRPRLSGFIEPCLPSPAPNPPAGDGWIHEIKLDGFRMLARGDGAGVRLLTRRGIDWTTRYPAQRAAAAAGGNGGDSLQCG
jgi:ATP-dependent DNA ligase